jgi:hypothetical protein
MKKEIERGGNELEAIDEVREKRGRDCSGRIEEDREEKKGERKGIK